ncbi:MAG: hypothetical protein M1824_002386 [Vezdaea acicularis]|nr:MAG: hypothetical protein M1824_002386 [Vezdaea acicularis]
METLQTTLALRRTIFQQILRTYSSQSKIQIPGKIAGAAAREEDVAAARSWVAQFEPNSIPRSICSVSFSRSSGPGGQNVNKVNSKATLRVALDSLLPLIPTLIHDNVRASSEYAAKSNSLVIQTGDSRKQADNVEGCFRKLYGLIMNAADCVIPGETSIEQQKKIKRSQKAGKEARLTGKKLHSDKKASRKEF